MKIITEPTVHLIAKQQIDESELNGFLNAHEVGHWDTDTDVDAERLVEVAGRVCYMSFAKPRPGGNHAYISHILEVGHGSVLEHAVFTLLITGVSRSLTHELVRHRAGFGYSQLSQRYVDESDCAFVVPEIINDDPDIYQIWEDLVSHSHKAYAAIADRLGRKLSGTEFPIAARKQAREAALSVLPNCTETKITITGNARALRHFLEMRGSVHADAEIRRLAVAVLGKLKEAAPNLFGDYVVNDGCISTQFRKV